MWRLADFQSILAGRRPVITSREPGLQGGGR